jgi:hypothetical protein
MLDSFGRVWRASFAAVGIALCLAVGGFGGTGARAQQPAAEPPSPQEAMPEAPAVQEPVAVPGEKDVAEFSTSLDLWGKQIGVLGDTVADDPPKSN